MYHVTYHRTWSTLCEIATPLPGLRSSMQRVLLAANHTSTMMIFTVSISRSKAARGPGIALIAALLGVVHLTVLPLLVIQRSRFKTMMMMMMMMMMMIQLATFTECYSYHAAVQIIAALQKNSDINKKPLKIELKKPPFYLKTFSKRLQKK